MRKPAEVHKGNASKSASRRETKFEAYLVGFRELEPDLELMNLETHSASLSVSLHTFVTPQQSNPTGSDRAAFVGTKTCAMAMLLW